MGDTRIQIRGLMYGLVIGLLLGLWFGVNIGKGRSIFSNPFGQENFTEKVKTKVGESVERIGKEIKGKDK
ncbi:MAG: hypothetical protein OEZ39_09665 [Gammaproteobacteria bacterium]|nr:hypothetical protein [Gammaproteobacteria bacterium]MDH5652111.1 hypothetical protein [Gammaproteobacteria bacterium]